MTNQDLAIARIEDLIDEAREAVQQNTQARSLVLTQSQMFAVNSSFNIIRHLLQGKVNEQGRVDGPEVKHARYHLSNIIEGIIDAETSIIAGEALLYMYRTLRDEGHLIIR